MTTKVFLLPPLDVESCGRPLALRDKGSSTASGPVCESNSCLRER
jgi:hypothetical protein